MAKEVWWQDIEAGGHNASEGRKEKGNVGTQLAPSHLPLYIQSGPHSLL